MFSFPSNAVPDDFRHWSILSGAGIPQIRGDAGCPEGMVSDPGLDAGAARPPLDHAVGVLLPHGLAGERAGLAGRRLE